MVRTSRRPASVKISMSSAMYWSVNLRVSCCRCGGSSTCISPLCLDFRYTESGSTLRGDISDKLNLLVSLRPSMNALCHSGGLMFKRSKSMSRMTSCQSIQCLVCTVRCHLLTRVSRESIRRQSTTERTAALSLIQQYIKPMRSQLSVPRPL